MSGHTQHESSVLTEEITEEFPVLLLYNDDVNTFDHVIASLIEICGHEPIQAEQSAWIVHTKGKCDVKRDAFEKLEKMCLQLLDRGLSAKIEA